MWGTNLQDVSCAVSPDRTPTAPRISSDVNVPLTQSQRPLWSETSSRLHRGNNWLLFSDSPLVFRDTWHDVTLHYLTPTCMAPAHTTPFWCHVVSFYRPRWTTFSCKCFGSFPGSIGASVAASQRVVTGLQQSYSWMAWRKHWWDGWKISGGHIVAVVRLWMFVMNALCSLCLRSPLQISFI